ncbi:MAG: sce7726 family protein [Eubacteriales bacterium]|nr:sce7726 family protein [Eubacteriales bacterium]
MVIYDHNIRLALINSFSKIPCYCTQNTIVINEFNVCGGCSRIDVAVVNGQLHGYEIKSERDNLERLPSQIENYNHVFNTMTIVVTEDHITQVMKLVPKWWGVQYVTSNNDILTIHTKRKGKCNERVDAYYTAQLLWKDELTFLLNEKTNKAFKLQSKSRRELAKLAAANIELPVLEESVREFLKARTNWKSEIVMPQCGD